MKRIEVREKEKDIENKKKNQKNIEEKTVPKK